MSKLILPSSIQKSKVFPYNILNTQIGIPGALTPGVPPWYLPSGVSASNCVAAYNATGASSLSNSYINLANPGVYTLAPLNGDKLPDWSSANGWFFKNQYAFLTDAETIVLRTGIMVQLSGFTIMARYAPVLRAEFSPIPANLNVSFPKYVIPYAGGYGPDPTNDSLNPNWYSFGIESFINADGTNQLYFGNNLAGIVSNYDFQNIKTIAMTSTKGYVDGDFAVDIPPVGDPFTPPFITESILDIGALLYPGGFGWECSPNKVMAFAVYNIDLTAPQISALSTAINLL